MIITDVVFLRQRSDRFRPNSSDNGDVFAVFPFLPHVDWLVAGYDHTGQHDGTSLWYIDSECEEITEQTEYADLMNELIRIGYHLRVVRKEVFYTSSRVTARR